jgi:hypothetical protein
LDDFIPSAKWQLLNSLRSAEESNNDTDLGVDDV